RVEAQARAAIEESLDVRAVLLRDLARPALHAGRADGLQARVRALGRETGTRYTVILADGRVLADSDHDPATMERHDLRPEVRTAAGPQGRGTTTRYSRTTEQEMIYLARAVRDGDRLLGWVRTSLPVRGVDASLDALRGHVLRAAGAAALLAFVLGLLLTGLVTGRLRRLAEGAQAIAEGRPPPPLPVRARDETGMLARALEAMDAELKHRFEKLARERNELFAVLGSMLEGVIAVDRERRVFHMNGVAGRLLGTLPSAARGRRIWEVTRVHAVNELVEGVLTRNASQSREVRLADGAKPRIVELLGSPIRETNHEARGAVVVLHDVTELRRLETVRREFVANVSHEIKTPLTAIRGVLETVSDDPSMDVPTRAHFLGRALDQTVRLSALVSDLLVLSRAESDPDGLERDVLDLRDVIRDSAGRLEPQARGREIHFHVQVPDEPTQVLGDAEAVRQIVDNLIDNAIKYTPEGGRVDLVLTHRGEHAVLEVRDTGIGIEPHHLDRIFERFYRVDKARSRALGGTGLGLAIVRHLARAQGGRVEVESRPGEGSTFRVWLPLRVRGGREAEAPEPGSP
ncbi:MAG: ATP-binding protein, partial [Planctomycetota bacterium]